MRLIALIAALFFLQAQALAQDTGNVMLRDCKAAVDQKPDAGAAYCLGYVAAIGQVRNFLSEKEKFCPSTQVTTMQMTRVVVQFMERNPSVLDKPFLLLALFAYEEAWPCK